MKKRKKTFTFWLSGELKERLEGMSDTTGVPMSEIARRAIAYYLDIQPKQTPGRIHRAVLDSIQKEVDENKGG